MFSMFSVLLSHNSSVSTTHRFSTTFVKESEQSRSLVLASMRMCGFVSVHFSRKVQRGVEKFVIRRKNSACRLLTQLNRVLLVSFRAVTHRRFVLRLSS